MVVDRGVVAHFVEGVQVVYKQHKEDSEPSQAAFDAPA
jgi:hypothetical protein